MARENNGEPKTKYYRENTMYDRANERLRCACLTEKARPKAHAAVHCSRVSKGLRGVSPTENTKAKALESKPRITQ